MIVDAEEVSGMVQDRISVTQPEEEAHSNHLCASVSKMGRIGRVMETTV